MGVGKIIAGAGIAAGTAYIGVKALEHMDADDIRAVGNSVKGFVGNIGDAVTESEIGRDLTEKINGTKYGPKVLGTISDVGGSISSGFDKFVDILVESKEAAGKDGTTLASNLAVRLTGAVSDTAEYLAEHVPSTDDIGKAIGGEASKHVNDLVSNRFAQAQQDGGADMEIDI